MKNNFKKIIRNNFTLKNIGNFIPYLKYLNKINSRSFVTNEKIKNYKKEDAEDDINLNDFIDNVEYNKEIKEEKDLVGKDINIDSFISESKKYLDKLRSSFKD